ncbi:MAG: hypothetical protein A3I11_00265 [Elusimicrobia bacterium RIFCSPLOWO2_02_FULL_39_32]|nr:MAG: hypothetical protein A3B80_03425 [Elusimicrobia bacterium RIFCSPHIGHO2_02_FULL_39_36]OGR91410.1 MAG: hypothetical protein A3I11_00265 [Elusimicrobia bacterium RIFCSPLOWO2_02_FULL_39_32]OGR98525.1 MAG: hypothetical protein A3G85_07205 [Elusimicrobia bacterium RIFCSPLOWO2_12_FULL_39_28]
MISSIKLLLPEIFLSGIAIFLLLLDTAKDVQIKRWSYPIALFSLFFSFFLIGVSEHGISFQMLAIDPFSSFFKTLTVLSCLLVVLISSKDLDLMGEQPGAYLSLLILSSVGTLFLSSVQDFFMLFVGLELTTIPLFILAGFAKKELKSSEGAIKFFLVGAFSTGIMLYGISLIYGLCGSTHFSAAQDYLNLTSGMAQDKTLFILAVIFILVGLGFKLSLVPFHQWTPDTYEGAPTPVTAFFSVSREAGVIVVMLRFFNDFANQSLIGLNEFFTLLAILTMTVGNIAALKQENLKRLLAYSSIAHAGTIFIGLVAGNVLGREGVMLYSLAYFLMSLGAFAVVIVISQIRKSEELLAFQGLARQNFPLAFLMLIFLMSLSGIPPFLGFWGKFYVFAAAIQSKMFVLVAVGLLNSVIAVYYYFKIVHAMFFKEPIENMTPIPKNINQTSLTIATGFAAFLILCFGIFPEQLISWIKGSAPFLP